MEIAFTGLLLQLEVTVSCIGERFLHGLLPLPPVHIAIGDLLAFGLVFMTVLAIGYFVRALLATASLAVAFALAAVGSRP